MARWCSKVGVGPVGVEPGGAPPLQMGEPSTQHGDSFQRAENPIAHDISNAHRMDDIGDIQQPPGPPPDFSNWN